MTNLLLLVLTFKLGYWREGGCKYWNTVSWWEGEIRWEEEGVLIVESGLGHIHSECRFDGVR